ncbi:hypothetical protein LEM8419_00232 [Neolewinella maritima]|uniref:Transglycosylase SLT domain-containing protein n=2 Tax=Neolewinella maritima TaxID=1383882 RepID=A0ABN8F4H0_9BACT|nr:hypothetical protein LEM8419_00232 [Neolewinella maritima]
MSEAAAERQARQIIELSRDEVERRLGAIDQSFLEYRVDDAVYRRIVNYLQDWPIASGRMLARSARFYPIFEEQLVAADLPLELKHLSIVESALRSWAISRVGAAGLWQLMPGTARELGLIVNDELDERLDPTLGCAAGLDYLRIQFDRYGDWALALAAYNSGPGNVNRAIRRSGSRNYWTLRRFLPRETRSYVPSFIAAVFLMSYHQDYGLPATQIPLDDQLTERILIRRELSLYRVAQVTGLRPEVVIEMNPQYLRGYLPGLRGGHLLQLPRRVVPAMREYLALHPAGVREDAIELPWSHPLLAEGELNADRYYVRREAPVEEGDSTARQVAARYDQAVDRLVIWSDRGELDTVAVGETFYYYEVEVFQPYDTRTRDIPPPATRLAADAQPRIPTSFHAYLTDVPEPYYTEPEEARRWWQLFQR